MTAHDQEDLKPAWFKRTIIRPSNDFERDAVCHVQRVLGLKEITGEMDEGTISHLRGFQHVFGLSITGYLDEQTAIQIERIRNQHAV